MVMVTVKDVASLTTISTTLRFNSPISTSSTRTTTMVRTARCGILTTAVADPTAGLAMVSATETSALDLSTREEAPRTTTTSSLPPLVPAQVSSPRDSVLTTSTPTMSPTATLRATAPSPAEDMVLMADTEAMVITDTRLPTPTATLAMIATTTTITVPTRVTARVSPEDSARSVDTVVMEPADSEAMEATELVMDMELVTAASSEAMADMALADSEAMEAMELVMAASSEAMEATELVTALVMAVLPTRAATATDMVDLLLMAATDTTTRLRQVAASRAPGDQHEV